MPTETMPTGFIISQVADMLGCATGTIRRWERDGKIKPPQRRNLGWRIYTTVDIEAMKQIIARRKEDNR